MSLSNAQPDIAELISSRKGFEPDEFSHADDSKRIVGLAKATALIAAWQRPCFYSQEFNNMRDGSSHGLIVLRRTYWVALKAIDPGTRAPCPA